MTKRPSNVGRTPLVERLDRLERLERDGANAVRSAVLGEELHHVVEAEATVAPLADAIERKLAAIAEALHRVDMEMEHLGDFRRSEHRSEFVDGHGPHVVAASL
jgi:hypothetical protein